MSVSPISQVSLPFVLSLSKDERLRPERSCFDRPAAGTSPGSPFENLRANGIEPADGPGTNGTTGSCDS